MSDGNIFIHAVSLRGNFREFDPPISLPCGAEDLRCALGADFPPKDTLVAGMDFKHEFMRYFDFETSVEEMFPDELNSLARHLEMMSELELTKLEACLDYYTELAGTEDIHISPAQCVELCGHISGMEPKLYPFIGSYTDYATAVLIPSLRPLTGGLPPPDLTIDLEKLGREALRDSPHRFTGGHLVAGIPDPLTLPDMGRLPEPRMPAIKVRVASASLPEGTWLNLPYGADGEEAFAALHPDRKVPGDTIENFMEVVLAKEKLGVRTLDECHVVECVSSFPRIRECFSGDYPSQGTMWWSANNAAYGLDESGQGGMQNKEKLKTVMAYTEVSHFDLLADLTQNLDCYAVSQSEKEIVREHLKGRGYYLGDAFLDSADLGEYIGRHAGEIHTVGDSYLYRKPDMEFHYNYYSPPEAQGQTMG